MRSTSAVWRPASLATLMAISWLGICAPSLAADSDLAEGRQLFIKGVAPAPACALCHTLKDAGSSGPIGPNLDELRPDAARVEKVIRNGMGPMPAFSALTDAQVSALARYVSTVAKP